MLFDAGGMQGRVLLNRVGKMLGWVRDGSVAVGHV